MADHEDDDDEIERAPKTWKQAVAREKVNLCTLFIRLGIVQITK